MSGTETISPATEDAAVDAIRAAHAAGTPLEIVGGGTRRGIGRPVQAERTLSAAKLTGITHYDPGEMVMTARTGTPMAEIQKALDKAKQRFVFEPNDMTALLGAKGKPTIGSVAATNNAGPRRFVAGAARDSLLGVRLVNGEGTMVKNGGRVMKNVTGLDLVKLMAGSWGTLGFITEVTFKVLPKPETETTLALRGLLDEDAIDALAQAMATSTDVSGAAHLPEMTAKGVLKGRLGSEPATLIRLEGFADSVKIRVEKLKALLKDAGEIEEIGAKDSSVLWGEVRDVAPFADGTEKPVWKVSMPPSQGHRMVMDLRMQAPVSALYDWQGGLVWLQMEDGEAHADTLRSAIARHGAGHATLIRAVFSTRAAVPVFQPQLEAVAALSRRIKASFDPKGILNPGRMGL